MKLTAKVTEVISGSESRDGQQRVKLKVAEADPMFKSLIVANTDDYALDAEVVLLVLTKDSADTFYHTLHGLQRIGQTNQIMDQVIDQLRPDAPPPFLTDTVVAYCDPAIAGCGKRHESPLCVKPMQADDATTQEFALGGTV